MTKKITGTFLFRGKAVFLLLFTIFRVVRFRGVSFSSSSSPSYRYSYSYYYPTHDGQQYEKILVSLLKLPKGKEEEDPHPNNNKPTNGANNTVASSSLSSILVQVPEEMKVIAIDLSDEEQRNIPQEGKRRESCTNTKQRCCIGAASGGGLQIYQPKEKSRNCRQNRTVYHRVRDLALHELRTYPVPPLIVGEAGAAVPQQHSPDTQSHDQHPPHTSPLHRSALFHCDICRIIYVASTLPQKRISFVGDSVQVQFFHGMECELSRRGFHLSAWKNRDWEDDQTHTIPKKKKWQYGVKTQRCFNVSLPNWMTRINEQQQQPPLSSSLSTSSYVEICCFKHYRPYMDMIQHKKIASISDVMIIDYGFHYLPRKFNEYELTINALLHTFKNIPDCYLIIRETSAQHFDNYFKEDDDGGNSSNNGGGVGIKQKLLSHIPFVQHFGGDHPPPLRYIGDPGEFNAKSQKCVPYKDDHTNRNRRKDIFYKAAQKQSYIVIDSSEIKEFYYNQSTNERIIIMNQSYNTLGKKTTTHHNSNNNDNNNKHHSAGGPFYSYQQKREKQQYNFEVAFLPLHSFTSKLHDLHPSNNDCTHYCYTPHTWYPSWRHLRIHMDRLFFLRSK